MNSPISLIIGYNIPVIYIYNWMSRGAYRYLFYLFFNFKPLSEQKDAISPVIRPVLM